jgi:hypothetical protein
MWQSAICFDRASLKGMLLKGLRMVAEKVLKNSVFCLGFALSYLGTKKD